MGTKARPAPNDCYEAAADDEPIFTLRGKDPTAPDTIRAWVGLRVGRGVNHLDDAKIAEALTCADAMEAWREAATFCGVCGEPIADGDPEVFDEEVGRSHRQHYNDDDLIL